MQLLRGMLSRSPSNLLRATMRNAIWNVGDYLVLPVLFLIFTPFLVHRLGVEHFGIWMLVTALSGMTGIFAFGLGDATIKYVSMYRARGDHSGVSTVVRSSMTMYAGLGILTAALFYVAAPLLARHGFKIARQDEALAVAALRIGGVIFAVRAISMVFVASLQGCERYDLSARITIVVKAVTLLAAVAAVALGHGVLAILCVSVAVIAMGAVALFFAARRQIAALSCIPIFHPAKVREIFSFGFYSWLQSLSSTVFAQADLLVVGSLLGTTAVTYYSVCQRVAMPVHSLLAAGSAFLFPMSSAALELGDYAQMRRIYARSFETVAVLAALMGVPLFVLAPQILTLWMGADFAQHAATVLRILALSYALLATSVIPWNVLNGTGHVRLNTLLGWFSVVAVLVVSLVLIPKFGLEGVALAKLTNILPLIVAAICVRQKVLHEHSWPELISYFAVILVPFSMAAIAIAVLAGRAPVGIPGLVATAAGSVAVTAAASVVVRKSAHLWISQKS